MNVYIKCLGQCLAHLKHFLKVAVITIRSIEEAVTFQQIKHIVLCEPALLAHPTLHFLPMGRNGPWREKRKASLKFFNLVIPCLGIYPAPNLHIRQLNVLRG